jgi:hypothetical protein
VQQSRRASSCGTSLAPERVNPHASSQSPSIFKQKGARKFRNSSARAGNIRLRKNSSD